MQRRHFLKGAACGLIAVANSAIARTSHAQARPNILWISLDDCRADALGCYGSAWAKTPHLDSLAEGGVRFHHAITQSPVCVPARRSMKTGRYVHEIGPMAMGKPADSPADYTDFDRMEVLDSAPNLVDAWSDAGTQPINVGKIHGFKRSFDLRGDAPPLITHTGKPTPFFSKTYPEESARPARRSAFTKTHGWQIGGVHDMDPEHTESSRLGDMATGILNEQAKQEDPFFLRVSFRAPHVACYVPQDYFVDPATIDLPIPSQAELDSKPAFERGPIRTYAGADLSRDQIDLCRGTYYGMVSLVDVQIGRILDALRANGQRDNTLIAVTSDQGFQLGEHGFWKKRAFYEGNVRVPFILNAPDALPNDKTIDAPVELIDFLPTLMDYSGLDAPTGIPGRSLRPLIEGDIASTREACFSEIDHAMSMYEELRQGTGRRVMVRTPQWKLIAFIDERVPDPDGALYNLADDPGEQVNLFGDAKYSDVVAKLTGMAHDWTQQREGTTA